MRREVRTRVSGTQLTLCVRAFIGSVDPSRNMPMIPAICNRGSPSESRWALPISSKPAGNRKPEALTGRCVVGLSGPTGLPPLPTAQHHDQAKRPVRLEARNRFWRKVRRGASPDRRQALRGLPLRDLHAGLPGRDAAELRPLRLRRAAVRVRGGGPEHPPAYGRTNK